MPIFQQTVDLNKVFSQLTTEAIFINDLAKVTEEDRANIDDLITKTYSGDMITLLPSCRCGASKGEHARDPTFPVVCPYCGTLVKPNIEDDIEPILWFRPPERVAPLLQPVIWVMLKRRFNKKGVNVLQWLTDITYKPKVKNPEIIRKLISLGVVRGYNNFVQNFDVIMDVLFNMPGSTKVKKGERDYLRELIQRDRDKIFTNYLPLPNKSLLIIEKATVGTYVDNVIVQAKDAISSLAGIDRDFYDRSERVKENRTARALGKIADFYEAYSKTSLSRKPGQFRRHHYGTRTIFAFRAVISSMTDTHDYRKMEVPWGIGVTAFRPHLLNKLFKMGMDHNAAIGLLNGHVEKYHPLIDQLLQELITEAGEKGIVCTLQRPPSLLQGSILCLSIARFKTDPHDHTIGLSILDCKQLNADFDGDCVICQIAIDRLLGDFWYSLEPMFSVLQLNRPNEISGMVAIPQPNISSMASWIAD